MDVVGGYRRMVTVGFMGGLNADLRKTRVPGVWRMERIICWSPIVKWSSEAK